MSDYQSLRSLFPQFKEEVLKKAIEISKCPVNWNKYNKWVEAGRPYEEHEEVLMNLKHEYESQKRSVGKSIDLYSFYYFVFMYMFGYIVKLINKILFKEPENMLTEEENAEMELVLRETPGMRIETPGKQAMELLPQQEPKPPTVRKVNIVVKLLDSNEFPTLARYTNQMIRSKKRQYS